MAFLANRTWTRHDRWGERDELIACGMLGMMKAVARYDAERGVKLRTYCWWCIRGEQAHYYRKLASIARREARGLNETEE